MYSEKGSSMRSTFQSVRSKLTSDSVSDWAWQMCSSSYFGTSSFHIHDLITPRSHESYDSNLPLCPHSWTAGFKCSAHLLATPFILPRCCFLNLFHFGLDIYSFYNKPFLWIWLHVYKLTPNRTFLWQMTLHSLQVVSSGGGKSAIVRLDSLPLTSFHKCTAKPFRPGAPLSW